MHNKISNKYCFRIHLRVTKAITTVASLTTSKQASSSARKYNLSSTPEGTDVRPSPGAIEISLYALLKSSASNRLQKSVTSCEQSHVTGRALQVAGPETAKLRGP